MTNSENNAKRFLDSQNPAFDWVDYEEQMREKSSSLYYLYFVVMELSEI